VQKEKFLLDWNLLLLERIIAMTGYEINYSLTNTFINETPTNIIDLRDAIHPKTRMQKRDPYFTMSPYFQVFAIKHGFVPNLSFIDLLFNEGSQAVYLCKQFGRKASDS
jgi:hypothetical protein